MSSVAWVGRSTVEGDVVVYCAFALLERCISSKGNNESIHFDIKGNNSMKN